jgi:hypothetical protein
MADVLVGSEGSDVKRLAALFNRLSGSSVCRQIGSVRTVIRAQAIG